ncbi:MAG: ATP-binding protein [Vicinamibacterales bacterium]
MARPKHSPAKPRRTTRRAARRASSASSAKRAPAKGRVPPGKRRPPEQLFALLDRAHQDSPDAKVRALLHELQVHGEEITAQNEQLRRAQAELEHARDRYADLYDFAPIGYLSVNRSGVITDVNLAGAALLGQSRSFLDRLPLISAAHPSRRLVLRRFLETCWAAPLSPCTIEIETNQSPTRVLRLTARVQGDGRAARLFTAAVDVTGERRSQLERAVALERVKALLDRLVTVQEDERGRIARNLHDHLGQQLTAMRLNISSLKDAERSSEDFRRRLEAIDKLAAGVDRDLDFLAWELRPVALDDVGLDAALAAFVTEWSSTHNVPAEFHGSPPGQLRLMPEIESQLYRIVQEALNNVSKHASAKSVSVLLERRGDDVILIVEDDGVGFNAATATNPKRRHEGLGLVSMQERAALVAGGVQIESGRGKGTTLFVRIPLRTVPRPPP